VEKNVRFLFGIVKMAFGASHRLFSPLYEISVTLIVKANKILGTSLILIAGG
jgi:hypothetical protein